jgi:ribosomal protein S18 acetylase RimI-like enzyme
MNNAALHRVRAEDWGKVRDVTLLMLADAPHTFGEPLAAAQARTDSEWQQLVEVIADPKRACAFLAEDADGLCGYVHGDSTERQLPPGSVLAGQLWVAPRQRGTGLGKRLMEAVTDWAISFEAESIVLGVLNTNLEVTAYYERLGYQDLGLRIPLPFDPERVITAMGKRLKP